MPRIKTILCFGDSLTAGYGLASSQAYPALIEQRIRAMGLPYRVINGGLNGDTSARGAQRIMSYLDQPIDILLLELGINDLPRGIMPAQTDANLQRIIDQVREKNPNCRLVLAGMEIPPSVLSPFMGNGSASAFNWAAPLISSFNALYRPIAERNKMAYIPFLLKGVAGITRFNQRDGIHPTAEGHQLMAETVWDVLSAVI